MKSPLFFRLFGKSPFHKLNKHIDIVSRSMNEMVHFTEAMQQKDREKMSLRFDSILTLESEADKLKFSIRRRMHGQWFMSISKTLITDYTHTVDNIANEIKDCAGMIVARDMVLPDVLQSNLSEILELSNEALGMLSKLVHIMPDLFEAGFRGPLLNDVYDHCESISLIESKIDKLHFQMRQTLWPIEHEFKPVDVVFWYKMFVIVSRISDWIERASGQYLLMVSK